MRKLLATEVVNIFSQDQDTRSQGQDIRPQDQDQNQDIRDQDHTKTLKMHLETVSNQDMPETFHPWYISYKS